MAKKNRSTLRGYFQEGRLPTEEHFAHLIDSSLNLDDDGFERSARNGFEISLVGENERLISFLKRIKSGDNPVWSIAYDKGVDKLVFHKVDEVSDQSHPVLTLASKNREGEGDEDTGVARVGVNNNDPRHELDVNGVVRSRGRIGMAPDLGAPILADGQWHDITGELTGCHALEVVAGVGSRGTGNYALIHAIALNAYNPSGIMAWLLRKRPIKQLNAFYRARGNRIKLRWHGKGRSYRLQIKSNCSYGEGVQINCQLSSLWLDTDMDESVIPPDVLAGGEK